MVEAGQVALPRRGNGRRTGGFAGRLGKSVPAGAGAAQGSFADRAAARAVQRGADDRAIAGADYRERGKCREPDSVFRGVRVAARDDRGVSSGAGNGEAAGGGAGAGEAVRGDRGTQGKNV